MQRQLNVLSIYSEAKCTLSHPTQRGLSRRNRQRGTAAVSASSPNISEEEIAYYRTHPELIQAVGDKATIHRVMLLVVFVAGFLLVVVSKSVKYGFAGSAMPWLIELIVDLVFELGIALWGGVATTVLLQDLIKRQYREGKRYQQAIIRQLATEEDETSGNT